VSSPSLGGVDAAPGAWLVLHPAFPAGGAKTIAARSGTGASSARARGGARCRGGHGCCWSGRCWRQPEASCWAASRRGGPARLLTHGVGAAPCAGAELELELDVRLAEDADADEDGELLVDDVADEDSRCPVEDGAAEELSADGVAGAVVVGADGVVVVPVEDEVVASSPSVVVPEGDEWPTSADTGFCPISSIPVTMAIATTKTETA
jgi:hypothetical protein